jgi:hypothetical protein
MARMVGPSGHIKAVDIKTQSGTRTIKADRAGFYSASKPSDIKALRAEGFTEENLARHAIGDAERGFNCVECGFGSWFAKCGRCGHDNSSGIPTDGNS